VVGKIKPPLNDLEQIKIFLQNLKEELLNLTIVSHSKQRKIPIKKRIIVLKTKLSLYIFKF
jgi:hypothetical protein